MKDRKPKNRPRSVQAMWSVEMIPVPVSTAIAKQMQATRSKIDLLLLKSPVRAIEVSSIGFGPPGPHAGVAIGPLRV